MKIAVLSFYRGLNERGVERWVNELFSRLSDLHEVTVFQNFRCSDKASFGVVEVGIKYDEEKPLRKLDLLRRAYIDYHSRRICCFTLKILPKLWKEKYDLIIPTDGGWEPAMIRILTWLRYKKMVIVGHSGKGCDDRNNLWSFPDRFVALTNNARAWARKVNPFVKIKLIPNGVDLVKFNPMGEKTGLKLEKPVILAVSALEKNKRLHLAINAVSKLKKGSLLVLGKGNEESALQKLGEDNLRKRFVIESVNFDEIPKYYRSADVFTLPSWKSEAFGMVYLEAMATGLPVVATDDEVRREIVGDAGILIDSTNIPEYAKALEKAVESDWGDKPRKQAEKFSWEIVSERYEELFYKLMNT